MLRNEETGTRDVNELVREVGAIQLLKEIGCPKIHFACIFSVGEGIEVLREQHPYVDLYLGTVDYGLNEHCYIVPGAGDMGDRLDGTK